MDKTNVHKHLLSLHQLFYWKVYNDLSHNQGFNGIQLFGKQSCDVLRCCMKHVYVSLCTQVFTLLDLLILLV